MGLENFGSVDEDEIETTPTTGVVKSSDVDTNDKPYNAWISHDGTLAMMEFDPRYVMNHISTELKDLAKERGLLFFDRRENVIVFTGDLRKYGPLVDAMGLEFAIEENMKHLEQLYGIETDEEEQTGLDAFTG